MVTLTRILAATDFSEASRPALEQARAFAAAFNAQLHIIHVVDEPLHETWIGYAPGPAFVDVVERLKADARKRLEEGVSQADLSTGRVVLATPWGDPSDEILRYARAHQVDLIICGTHGRRGWNRVVMGSVAERIVRLASCPVLTTHSATRAAAAA